MDAAVHLFLLRHKEARREVSEPPPRLSLYASLRVVSKARTPVNVYLNARLVDGCAARASGSARQR
jgi:hypothetical protein